MSEVSREYMGRARLFHQRVRAADHEYCAVRTGIWRSLRARLLRKPSFRQPETEDLFRQWQSIPACGERGESTMIYQKRRVEFRNVRLTGTRRLYDNGSSESAVSASVVRLVADACYEKIGGRPHLLIGQPLLHIVSVGLHGLARYYQRAFQPSDEALIDSLWSVFWLSDQIILPGSRRFAIPAGDGGAWLGNLETRLELGNGGESPGRLDLPYVSIAIKTYHSDRSDPSLWVSEAEPDPDDDADGADATVEDGELIEDFV